MSQNTPPADTTASSTKAACTGRCACGAVEFLSHAPVIATAACHCTDCQKASGGAANHVALLPRATFEITKGSEVTKAYTRPADSGRDARRIFCAECGTPLWSEPEGLPFHAVKVGALDHGAELRPQMHIYTASAPDWHLMETGIPGFPGMPPVASID